MKQASCPLSTHIPFGNMSILWCRYPSVSLKVNDVKKDYVDVIFSVDNPERKLNEIFELRQKCLVASWAPASTTEIIKEKH